MLVARYFLFVGGALLALLVAAGSFVPTEPAPIQSASGIDKSIVRIRSDQKLPERVVYDTSLPTILPAVPAPLVAAAAAPTPVAAVAPVQAQAKAGESVAELVTVETKKPEAQAPKKRKVARAHQPTQLYPGYYYQPQPPMRVAQQSRFGFFGGPTWSW
jgi:hypothetical protein